MSGWRNSVVNVYTPRREGIRIRTKRVTSSHPEFGPGRSGQQGGLASPEVGTSVALPAGDSHRTLLDDLLSGLLLQRLSQARTTAMKQAGQISPPVATLFGDSGGLRLV